MGLTNSNIAKRISEGTTDENEPQILRTYGEVHAMMSPHDGINLQTVKATEKPFISMHQNRDKNTLQRYKLQPDTDSEILPSATATNTTETEETNPLLSTVSCSESH